MDQVKFVEESLCLAFVYHFKIFKGSLIQILIGPFLNTLAEIQFS